MDSLTLTSPPLELFEYQEESAKPLSSTAECFCVWFDRPHELSRGASATAVGGSAARDAVLFYLSEFFIIIIYEIEAHPAGQCGSGHV